MMKMRMNKTAKIFTCAVLALILTVSAAASVLAYEIFIDMGEFDFAELREMEGSFSSRVFQFPDLPNEADRGTLTYNWTFTSDRAGTFYMWARIHHQDGSDNSFFYIDDNGDQQIFDGFEPWGGTPLEHAVFEGVWYDTFYWQPVGPRDENNTPWLSRETFNVVAGENTFVVSNREPRFIVDMIILTTNPDYDPRELDDSVILAAFAESRIPPPPPLETPADDAVPAVMPTPTPAPRTNDAVVTAILLAAVSAAAIAAVNRRKVRNKIK